MAVFYAEQDLDGICELWEHNFSPEAPQRASFDMSQQSKAHHHSIEFPRKAA
jgi:hypothetical protein